MGVRAALALDCSINNDSVFARKNYFYPDLPKGYQISQYELPFSEKGRLEFELGGQLVKAGITRVHMEEDAGKTLHGLGGASAVDLNRAGVPLVEVVGDPDLRSSAQAAQYMRALREILMFIGVNDGNMEEGSFRCDANISLRPRGASEFGTRVELKNINSFRFVQRAIDAEILRQTAVLDAGQSVVQETRSFDPATLKTATLRSKGPRGPGSSRSGESECAWFEGAGLPREERGTLRPPSHAMWHAMGHATLRATERATGWRDLGSQGVQGILCRRARGRDSRARVVLEAARTSGQASRREAVDAGFDGAA
jgi:hypothetical protein